jgi:hypothetical protein
MSSKLKETKPKETKVKEPKVKEVKVEETVASKTQSQPLDKFGNPFKSAEQVAKEMRSAK